MYIIYTYNLHTYTYIHIHAHKHTNINKYILVYIHIYILTYIPTDAAINCGGCMTIMIVAAIDIAVKGVEAMAVASQRR